MLLATSVDHERAPVAGVRANVLLSRYLIEPCGSGRSKLTYMCRIDLRCGFCKPSPSSLSCVCPQGHIHFNVKLVKRRTKFSQNFMALPYCRQTWC